MIQSTIFPATPDDSAIHRRPYYGMQCDAEMMQQIINKATTTLKIEYMLQTNKLALMTNVLIYVSRRHVMLVLENVFVLPTLNYF